MEIGSYVAYENGFLGRKFSGRGYIVDIKDCSHRKLYFIQNSSGIVFREECDVIKCQKDYMIPKESDWD